MSNEFGGFGLNDVAPDAIVTMTNEDTAFPKEWAVNGLPNEPVQASTTNCKIRFEFASAKNIKLVALIGHNMQDGDTIKCNVYNAAGWGAPQLEEPINLEPRWYERIIFKLGENVVSPFDRANIFSVMDEDQKYYEIELSGAVAPLVGEVCLFEDSFQFNRNYNWEYERIFAPNTVVARTNKTFVSKQSTEAENFRLSFMNVSEDDRPNLYESFRAKGRNNLFIPDYEKFECFYGMVAGKSFPLKNQYTGMSFGINFEESSA